MTEDNKLFKITKQIKVELLLELCSGWAIHKVVFSWKDCGGLSTFLCASEEHRVLHYEGRGVFDSNPPTYTHLFVCLQGQNVFRSISSETKVSALSLSVLVRVLQKNRANRIFTFTMGIGTCCLWRPTSSTMCHLHAGEPGKPAVSFSPSLKACGWECGLGSVVESVLLWVWEPQDWKHQWRRTKMAISTQTKGKLTFPPPFCCMQALRGLDDAPMVREIDEHK